VQRYHACPSLVQVSDYVFVLTVTPDRESAALLAASAVRDRLAAGAQVYGPVASFFWHLGESGEGEEWQVVLKTTMAAYADLERHILSEHPWDKPEVVAVPLVAGSQPFLQWLANSTARREASGDSA
jgi:periplasmic divalent cation tolerance protein